MTAGVPTFVVSFRDADEPRALAARLIASAYRHPRGWTVNISHGDRLECQSFEAVTQTVARRTNVPNLLIVWAGGGR